MKGTTVKLLEAALIERDEYLEELQKKEEGIQEQIANLQHEIDGLLIKIYDSYRNNK